MKKYIAFLLGFLILLFVGIFSRFLQIQAATKPRTIASIQAKDGFPVETVRPIQRDLSVEHELLGSIEAVQEAKVCSRVDEVIVSSDLQLGKFFPAQASAVKLSCEVLQTKVSMSEAALNQAEAALNKARNGVRAEDIKQARATGDALMSTYLNNKKELERMTRLRAVNAISEQRAEKIQSDADTSLARLKAAQYQLNKLLSGTRKEDLQMAEAQVQMAEAQLKLARINCAYTDVKTPFSGHIAAIHAEPGEFIGKDKPLFDIVNLDQVYLVVDVPESFILDLKDDGEVICSVKNQPETKFAGIIKEISPRADMISRTFVAKILLKNVDHKLRPGMLASAKFSQATRPNSILVPETAVCRRENSDGVFVVQNQKAKFLPIKTGIRRKDLIEVLTGLTNLEDEVVVAGSANLTNGASVKAVKGSTQ